MEKECCQINVTELDNGYRIEITGENIKEKCNCPQILQQCCSEQLKTATDKKNDCC